MGKTLRDEELAMIILSQLHSHMLAVGRRALANIHGYIQYPTLHTSHQLALGEWRALEVQAPHHTIAAHALVVLAEVHLIAYQWLHLLLKLSLAVALEEVATSISEKAWLDDEHALYICLYYVHFLVAKLTFNIQHLTFRKVIHLLIILLIVTARHVVHPFLVVKIPLHGFLNTLLKLQTWLPTKFSLKLSRVDGITHIVPLSIGNVSYQIHIRTLRATEQSIYRLYHHLDDVDVLPLVEATDVVSLGYLSLMENQVDGSRMVLHIQPVSHVLTLTIYWQWLAMADVIDEQWNQLLRELIRTIVVGAVGHDGRHTVSIVESTHEMVGASLRCRVRRMRIVLGRLSEELLAIRLMVLATRSLSRGFC